MMKYYIYTVPFLLVIAGFFLLSNNDSSADDYRKISDGIRYSLDYIPNTMLIERDLKDSKDSYSEVADKYKDHCYFKLRINSSGGQDILKLLSNKFGEAESNEIIRILSFHSKENLKLNINNIELPCSLYHLDRTFVEQKGLELIAVFNLKSIDDLIHENNNVEFEFNAELFETELIKFDLPDDILRKLTKV